MGIGLNGAGDINHCIEKIRCSKNHSGKSLLLDEDTSEIMVKLEPKLKRFCQTRDNPFNKREDLLYAEDALYEISPSIKNYWNTIYARLQNPKDKYEALLRFVNAREQYLGESHTESVNLLKQCGWTAADVMAAYIHARVGARRLILSPDAAQEAAKEDWNAALQLLEGENYDLFFPFSDKSYQIHRQFEWIDFLYCFAEYGDDSFLRKTHKSKRLCKHCEKILENRSHCPVDENTFSINRNAPDFSAFDHIVLQQKHLIRSAGGQKLRNGNSQNAYYVMSYHLVDEQQGCAAALCFEPLNKAPEYGDQSVHSKGVYFYRFRHLYLSDYVPESRRKPVSEIPKEFADKAYRAFSKAADLAVK